MAKIKIDNDLFEKAKKFAEKAGYSSVEEFVGHALEQAIGDVGDEASEEEVKERLKGLGYIS